MQSEDLSSHELIYVCMLKACGLLQDAMNERIYHHIANHGLLYKHVVLADAYMPNEGMARKLKLLVRAIGETYSAL